jgi:hypothetical protein
MYRVMQPCRPGTPRIQPDLPIVHQHHEFRRISETARRVGQADADGDATQRTVDRMRPIRDRALAGQHNADACDGAC